jgi:hypothetical protein
MAAPGTYPGDGYCPDGFRVLIYGTQHFSGEVTRVIFVDGVHSDHPITSAQALALGRALIAAASAYDAVSDPDARIDG